MQTESSISVLDPLPDDSILVHIGPHKTGTTAVQTTFARSRLRLADQGVLYPGATTAHHREARSLIRRRSGWDHDNRPPPPMTTWTTFAQRATSLAGRVVISSELFADATEAECGTLVRTLGADRVHVLVAARNPAGIAVSNWQQVIKTYGRFEDLDAWLDVDFRRDGGTGVQSMFWLRVDTTALVSRWLSVLPPERITVVALDEGDRLLLPTTFEQLLGLPDGSLAEHEVDVVNRGLSAVEITMIRRINELLHGQLSWAEYSRMMRSGVIPRLLTARKPGPDETRTPLPQWAVEQAVLEAERNITGLRASGVRIAGDLSSLRKAPEQARQDVPITAVPLDVAAEAVVGAITTGVIEIRKHNAKKSTGRWPRAATSAATSAATKAAATKAAARSARPAGAPKSPRIDNVGTLQLAAVLARRVRTRLGRLVARTDR